MNATAEPPTAGGSRRGLTVLALAAGGVLFTIAATLNAAGYRYGVGDQATYIPTILRQLDPRLFPRDGVLFEVQSRLMLTDEIFAGVVRLVPSSLEAWFLALYVATLALLFAGLVRLGSSLLASPWSVAAFVAAVSLRHRITKTGANTLEGYFHPRQLAFACGVVGLAEVARGRPWTALAAAVLAAAIHPTTGLWFLGWIGLALVVEQPRLRPALAIAAGVGAAAGVALLATGFVPVTRMDDAWVATLAGKDYLFPTTDWGVGPWVANLLYPVIITATWLARRSRGLLRPGETGLVVGCLALVAVFLVTLPLVASRVAVAVQLRIPRVFWMADLFATLGVVWWLAERGRRAGDAPAATSRVRRPALVFAALTLFALGRGGYVLYVEHPGRPLVSTHMPQDDWADVAAYLRRDTPPATHVLVNPNHAWRFGTSLRVAAARDVFLENVKDEAMSMYNRPMALRVAERQAALGAFEDRTAADLQALARRYGLDVVVAERDLGLPELYRNHQFRVYRLTP